MQKLKFLDKLLAVPQQWAGKPGLKMTFIAQCTKASTWVTGQRIRELSHFERQTAKSLQSCPTLCGPRDSSPPGSPVPGILQARTLEWVAISFSNAWKWKVKVKSLSRVRPLATHGLQPTRLLPPWDFPGKSTGVGCHCLLQEGKGNLILSPNRSGEPRLSHVLRTYLGGIVSHRDMRSPSGFHCKAHDLPLHKNK